jgi:hypothetical protein
VNDETRAVSAGSEVIAATNTSLPTGTDKISLDTVLVVIDGALTVGELQGYQRGWDDRDMQVQATFGLVRGVLDLPTQEALAQARAYSNEPCPRRCRSCSRCYRFEIAYRNRARYGCEDFPGGPVDWIPAVAS